MLVSRSEVSLRVWIQRESCVTGANAMSASLADSGTFVAALRTKRDLAGPDVCATADGLHTVAGERVSSSATLRGPVRRSRSAARVRRQLSAAIWRSDGVIVTCISFSASAKVAGVTSGPTCGAVPNAGGAPGVVPGVLLAGVLD